ncbi:MAG: hypothetical protein IPN79_00480 [Saprospiraceae bacterium]|nr:hypothetical protein [Saprospiraceae bacterium]
MNRLILVGNGFDLAHGMKTSYADFILWYFQKCWEEAKQSQTPNPNNITELFFKNELFQFSFGRNLVNYTTRNSRIDNISVLESLVQESSQSETNFPSKLKITSPF